VHVRSWTKDPRSFEIGPEPAAGSAWGSLIAAAITGVAAPLLVLTAERREVGITGQTDGSEKANSRALWRASWRAADGAVGVSTPILRAALPGLGRTVTILVDPTGRRATRLETDVIA
jgi:hypothetical protein